MEAAFKLGKLLATPGLMESITPEEMAIAIGRHHNCDWGDVCKEDKEQNELSLKEGMRILSSYKTEDGVKFWIITEADRASTTVLLPSEY